MMNYHPIGKREEATAKNHRRFLRGRASCSSSSEMAKFLRCIFTNADFDNKVNNGIINI